jgi:hypothetical protein
VNEELEGFQEKVAVTRSVIDYLREDTRTVGPYSTQLSPEYEAGMPTVQPL